MLNLDLSKRAGKYLSSVPKKHLRQIVEKLEELRINPRPQDSKPLKGFPYLRADIGEHRIIYHVENTILRVPIIGKRNDNEVYRRLERMER